jgi:hypothetical protein
MYPTAHLHLELELRMNMALLYTPCMPSRCAHKKIQIFTFKILASGDVHWIDLA